MILLPLKERTARSPKAPAGRPCVGGAERLGGVDDVQHAVLGEQRGDPGLVGALPVEVDHHRGLRAGGPAARASSSASRSGDRFHEPASLSISTGVAPV